MIGFLWGLLIGLIIGICGLVAVLTKMAADGRILTKIPPLDEKIEEVVKEKNSKAQPK